MGKSSVCFCSFCGKSSREVKKMIGSPIGTSYICESCAQICYEVFNGQNAASPQVIDKIMKELKTSHKKTQEELAKHHEKELEIFFEYSAKITEFFGRIDQTIVEATRILTKIKQNLDEPETLEKAKDEIEIVIDMLSNRPDCEDKDTTKHDC